MPQQGSLNADGWGGTDPVKYSSSVSIKHTVDGKAIGQPHLRWCWLQSQSDLWRATPRIGLKPLIQPLVQALIAEEKDQLSQLLHDVAFAFGEHFQAVGGEGAMRHHVPEALSDQEYIVAFAILKGLHFLEQLLVFQKPGDPLFPIGMVEIQPFKSFLRRWAKSGSSRSELWVFSPMALASASIPEYARKIAMPVV